MDSIRFSWLVPLVVTTVMAQTQVIGGEPHQQRQDLVFGETSGVGLLMDIFAPTENKNGLGVVNVVSGAWYSDRGKIRDHERAQTFRILCVKGYTVFAVRPGSITKFSAPEMVDHLKQGIRWVKVHSAEYGIDPTRLGLMGASAGGHLACLAAVTAEPATKNTDGKLQDVGTEVRAVAVFFPPTDFLNWRGSPLDVHEEHGFGAILRRLAFQDGLGTATQTEIDAKLTAISPARLVTDKTCPMLLLHGDADPVVPLQQSERMLEALKAHHIPAELIIKPGGAHPWPTLHEEVEVLANWFDRQLREAPQAP